MTRTFILTWFHEIMKLIKRKICQSSIIHFYEQSIFVRYNVTTQGLDCVEVLRTAMYFA